MKNIFESLLYFSGSQPFGNRVPPNQKQFLKFDLLRTPYSLLYFNLKFLDELKRKDLIALLFTLPSDNPSFLVFK
jgi:hypothetical protein